jgi:hypothetical protein
LIITVFFSEIHAQTFLSGEISGYYPGGDYYIVQGTVHILPGKTARFAPGSRFYFDQYSGIMVHGNLVCEGSRDSLIIFSSVREKPSSEANVKAEPFDWNGIQVKSSSDTLILSYTKLSYSSLGIAVESESTCVRLHAVQFSLNGSNNFSRGGRVIPFADYVDINYSTEYNESRILTKDTVPEEPTRQNIARKREPRKALRAATIITTCATAISGGVLWITGEAKARQYHDLYMQQTIPDEVVRYRERRDKWISMRNKGVGFCIGGCVTFPLNFIFKRKHAGGDSRKKDNKNP